MSATNGTAHANGSSPRVPLRSEVRKARARMATGDRGAVVPNLPLWDSATRIGGGITPARISSIIRTADSGDVRQLIDIANECRQRDTHLQAVLGTSEETSAALAWQLTLPEDARAKDKRAMKWAEDVLRACTFLPRLIAHLAGAVFYSFAVAEILWRKKDGRLVPVDAPPVAHRRFAFRVADGRLVWSDSGTKYVGVDFQAEYPRKFIVAQPRVNGDVPSREGLMRPLVWYSIFRNWDLSDWLHTAEISWKPWRIGTYKKAVGTNNEDRAALESIMRRLTTDGSVVKPDTMEIEVNWPGGSSSTKATHAELYRALSDEISKCVLGQTETTQSSTSSGYAQAKIHNEVRRDILESRACQIAAVLTRDLVTPLIELNFAGVKVPEFEFVTQDSVDLKAFSEAIRNLKDAGQRIPEAWLADQTGIPLPKDDERILGGPDPNDPEEPTSPQQPPVPPNPNAPDAPDTQPQQPDATQPDQQPSAAEEPLT